MLKAPSKLPLYASRDAAFSACTWCAGTAAGPGSFQNTFEKGKALFSGTVTKAYVWDKRKLLPSPHQSPKCANPCLSPYLLHELDRRWVWKACCPTLLLERRCNQSEAHKQKRARGAWSSHVLGQNSLFRWVFQHWMQPPWSLYGQHKSVTFWWQAYVPWITLSDLSTGTHRLKNIWHDNTDFSCSLAKLIWANSIKHCNVLLSNEFPKKGQTLCYAS